MHATRRVAAVAALLIALLAGCADTEAPPPQGPDDAALVAGNTAFALDLYKQLCAGRDGNLVVSPFSVSAALTMTWAGARGNTEAQMANVLHLDLGQPRTHAAFSRLTADLEPGKEHDGYRLDIANSLWGQQGYRFKKPFLNLVGSHYAAGLERIDFAEPAAAAQAINAWAAKHTGNRIRAAVPDGTLSPATRLVLANAIYFKGQWASRFDERRTKPMPFKLLGGEEVEVLAMHQKAQLGYLEIDGLQVLELLYQGGDFSMVLLLPSARDGLSQLEDELSASRLEQWVTTLRPDDVEVDLPKFRSAAALRLGGPLKAMGMADAFGPETADFSGITAEEGLFIFAVLHSAFIEVDEKGTEAAVATHVLVPPANGAPHFTADRPFLYLIRHIPSGSLLFLGRVVDPRG